MIPSLSMSSQFVRWEPEKNSELNTDKLATSLRWKKTDSKDPQNKKKKLTASGKSRLKEEFQKLFQWDSIAIR